MNARSTTPGARRTPFYQRLILPLILSVVVLAGCSDDAVTPEPSVPAADTYAADVAVDWFDLSLTLTRETPGFSPPVAARAFGYTGVALYEAVRPGMQGYRSLSGQLNGLNLTIAPDNGEAYHWGASANAALASMMRQMYPLASAVNFGKIDQLERQYHDAFVAEVGEDVVKRSEKFGRDIAAAIYAWSVTDGGAECFKNNFPTDFTMPEGPGLWVPTPPAFQVCLQPRWGDMRPFITASVMECQPPPPPAFSLDPASTFYIEAQEVHTVTGSLSQEERVIAQYWSDDPGKTATPPGHSVAVTGSVLKQAKVRLGKAAEAYARIGIGVHDAFVSCWKAKYTFNLIRPVSYIRDHIDADWMPMLNTPPFPEYPSGHSVQSGATAKILADLFGDNFAFIDHTHEGRTDFDGTPRSFSSFYDMADEAAMSRLYGGIHYRAAIELGVDQGIAIGARVGGLRFRN